MESLRLQAAAARARAFAYSAEATPQCYATGASYAAGLAAGAVASAAAAAAAEAAAQPSGVLLGGGCDAPSLSVGAGASPAPGSKGAVTAEGLPSPERRIFALRQGLAEASFTASTAALSDGAASSASPSASPLGEATAPRASKGAASLFRMPSRKGRPPAAR